MKLKLLLITVALFVGLFGTSYGQIISQYVETNSGTTPKGIEIWNNTAGVLNFATNNLVIQQGTNGADPAAVVTVSTGTLAVGAVMVIGTSDIGTYLTGQSIGATFVPFTFTINGDDALVVKYGAATTDTFGISGSDPGTEWVGSGVSTANQNIAIISGITTGSSGFTDTSTRFSTISTTPSTLPAGLSGFGVAPISAAVPVIVLANNGTQVGLANVNQGTAAHVLHKFQLGVSTANASLTGITCTTAGSYIAADISNLKVRYSANAILDAGDVTLSTLTNPGVAGAKSFPTFTAQAINSGTTGFIFITADIAAGATHNNTISVNAIATTNVTFASGNKSGSTTAGAAQTIKDVTAPVVSAFLPLDNATGVAINSNLVLTFSESIIKGTGNILIRRVSDNSTIQTIDVATGPVSVLTNSATIDPGFDLAVSTAYYIEIPNTAFRDTASNFYTGTTGATAWNFTTITPIPVINVEGNIGTFPDITPVANTPSGLDNTLFAQQTVGVSQTKSFRIQNLGSLPLTISSVTIVGTNPSEFSVSTTPPGSIAAGATVTFEVTFLPTSFGLKNAIVRIANNSNNITPNFDFNIQGTGNNPEIAVTGNSNNIPDGTTTTTATNNTLLGEANANIANPTTVSRNFVISNSGNVNLTISGITFSGTDASQFSVSPTSTSIAAGGTGIISVTFAPTSTGVKNATISIANNDLTDNENLYTFALKGTALSYVACEAAGEQILTIQDFDNTAPTWNYTVGALTFYDFGGTSSDGFWGITTSAGLKSLANNINYTPITNNFLFLQDLQCENGDGCANTTGTGILTFENVDISNKQNVKFSFDYDIYQFDNGDGVFYELFYDGVSQGEVQFITGLGDLSTESTININIPSNVSDFYFILKIQQNGPDAAGFDNFKITYTQSSEKIWNGTVWSGDGLPPTSSQKAVIDGNLTLPYTIGATTYDTLEGCECQVNSNRNVIVGNVSGTIPAILNIQGLLANDGNITINQNSSLVQHNHVTNLGEITYKRTAPLVTNTDYTYWASPVAGYTLGGVSKNLTVADKYYFYNSAVGADGDWEQASAATPMIPGIGYIIRGPEPTGTNPPSIDNFDAFFTGVPNNGPYSISGLVADKSYLLGNPYPSTLDADTFLNDNNGVLNGTLYFWTHNTLIDLAANITNPDPNWAYAYSLDDYAVYNITGGVGIDPGTTVTESAPSDPQHSVLGIDLGKKPTGKIAAGQGFFASTKTTLSGSPIQILYNNSMRVGVINILNEDNSQFFKTRNPKTKTTTFEKHRIWLNLTNAQGAFKQTLVGYITDATNQYDNRFDGETFDGNEFVDFYSISQEKNLVIQGRALPFDENDQVPLGFRTTINGDFTIKIDQKDGVLTNQAVFIEDKLTNTIFDLRSGPFTFNTAAGTFNDRFVLRYTDETLGTIDLETGDNQVLVSNKNKQIKVNSAIKIIDKVTVYDLLGRQLFKKDKVNSNELSILHLISNAQTLLVKVTLQNGQTVTKKIIF